MIKIICSLIISCGLACLGYFATENGLSSKQLVEVKGLSEKIVRSDYCDISIEIKNEEDTLELLYNKHKSDKLKIDERLKQLKIQENEISGGRQYIDSRYVETIKKRKFFISETIRICTRNLEIARKLEKIIPELMSYGMLVTCSYSYLISDFNKIKLEMMEEAALNAKSVASAFVEPLGYKLGEVSYLNQGLISIKAPNESSDSDWSFSESKSIDKKLRLVVRAGFTKIKNRSRQ